MTSVWSWNSFIVLPMNFFLNQSFLSNTELKNFLIHKHYKTVWGPVRNKCSSWRVFLEIISPESDLSALSQQEGWRCTYLCCSWKYPKACPISCTGIPNCNQDMKIRLIRVFSNLTKLTLLAFSYWSNLRMNKKELSVTPILIQGNLDKF